MQMKFQVEQLYSFIYFMAASGHSCGAWASLWLQLAGSVACGFTRPPAYGILVPQPEMKPASASLEDRLFTTGPPGKSLGIPVLTWVEVRNLSFFWDTRNLCEQRLKGLLGENSSFVYCRGWDMLCMSYGIYYWNLPLGPFPGILLICLVESIEIVVKDLNDYFLKKMVKEIKRAAIDPWDPYNRV